MILGVLLSVMTVAALAFVLLPLLRGARDADPVERDRENLAVYRERLSEIEDEAASGILATEEAEAARNELAGRLVGDMGTPSRVSSNHSRPADRRTRLASVIILALLLPSLAIAMSWYVGGWSDTAVAQIGGQGRQLSAAILRLKEHLARQPDDIKGWNMLGEAYTQAGLFQDAAQAFAHANRLSGGKSAELLVAQGAALGRANNEDFRGKPRQLFDQALKLDPDFSQALWFAGVADYQVGEYAKAATLWKQLKGRTSLPPKLAKALDDKIAQAESNQPTPAVPNDAGKKRATPAAEGVKIPVHVVVAPELAGSIPPNATLFVFAKAVNGPAMPLAVVKRPAHELPATVTLDDKQAMKPGLKLSSFDQWVITARISPDGSATPASGDLYGTVTVTRSSLPETVSVKIDHRAS